MLFLTLCLLCLIVVVKEIVFAQVQLLYKLVAFWRSWRSFLMVGKTIEIKCILHGLVVLNDVVP